MNPKIKEFIDRIQHHRYNVDKFEYDLDCDGLCSITVWTDRGCLLIEEHMQRTVLDKAITAKYRADDCEECEAIPATITRKETNNRLGTGVDVQIKIETDESVITIFVTKDLSAGAIEIPKPTIPVIAGAIVCKDVQFDIDEREAAISIGYCTMSDNNIYHLIFHNDRIITRFTKQELIGKTAEMIQQLHDIRRKEYTDAAGMAKQLVDAEKAKMPTCTSALITHPKSMGESRADCEMSDGSTYWFAFFNDEIHFIEAELFGCTVKEIQALKFEKDKAYMTA